MNDCLKSWYSNVEFKNECEQMYLEKRKRYRETGIIHKEEKRPYYLSGKKFNPKYPDDNDIFRNRDKKNAESNKSSST